MDSVQDIGTEARILAAAEEVFMRDSFDGARMQVIAEAAGINKAMLHYYFRSKEKLFEQVLQKRIGSFLPEVTAAFTSKQTLEERIEAFVDAYLKFLTSNPQLPMFILFSIYRNPKFVELLPRTMFEVVTTYFSRETQAGRLKNVDPGHFLISLLSMCIFPYVARPVASHMMGKDQEGYDAFLSERKTEIMKIIRVMTQP
ncbi:MAG TPA: TetR/AcrR family transcriptional regulator [Saprospiraceae bacterium]|nr:TetR/AcrR family transcriptional regulator [Saprospiraceae bacterium]